MYIVRLKDYNYTVKYFNELGLALDFAIEHYKEFLRITDKNGDTIYNNINHNGIGGFTFTYYCERIG